MRFELSYPIKTVAGDTVTALEITRTRFTAGDVRQAKLGNEIPYDFEIGIVARLTGLLPEDVQLLDHHDFAKLQNKAADILSPPEDKTDPKAPESTAATNTL